MKKTRLLQQRALERPAGYATDVDPGYHLTRWGKDVTVGLTVNR